MSATEAPILIVDDDPFILDLVARFFTSKGFRVVSTTDPERAYALAEAETPRLIISDLAMPGLDGFTLFQGFKSNRVLQQVPLVLLTGSDKIDDIEKGYSLGAQAYLLKPVDWTTAWPKIEKLLKKSNG
jgi:DNA-binding response OmpR family regulator